MSAPAPICHCSQEVLLTKYRDKDIEDNCPLCLRVGSEVAIGFHRSQLVSAAPLPPISPAPSTNSLSQFGHIQPVNVADAQAIASANALWTAIQRVPDDPAVYRDPAQLLELPFPFPGESMPVERFDLHQHDQQSPQQPTFTYMGRQRFQEILQEVPVTRAIRAQHAATHPTSSPASAPSSAPAVELFPPVLADIAKRSITTFIYGTIGWGKSHLLAAMVCLLMRKGRRVLYLPDCKRLVRDPVDYFRSALLLTFAMDPALQNQVAQLVTIDQVIAFCKSRRDLTYIIDQYNALEQDMKKDDAETLAAKSTARRMIDRATFDRATLLAASANNFTARVIHDKQLNMNIVTLFGGMTQEEMSAWYRQFHCLESSISAHPPLPPPPAAAAMPIDSRTLFASRAPSSTNAPLSIANVEDMRRRLEDVTGCIPLYLRSFVNCTPSSFAVTWQMQFAQDKRVRRVFDHLLAFYSDLKKQQSAEGWRMHVEVLRCFLLGGAPHTDEYDHRYFYEDERGFGHIACGLARGCLASVIRLLDGDNHFVDGAFLSNIKTTRNPSMRGFLIEEACLTYIRHNGLLLPSPFGLVKPDVVRYFDTGEAAAVGATAGAACVFYIPRPYNYKSIDCILRRLTYSQNEHGQQVATGVLLVPIQVTISASHSSSPDTFYPSHRVWLHDIDDSVARQHVFVWLRRDARERVTRSWETKGTRQRDAVTLSYDEVTVTFNTLSGDLHVSTSPPRPRASAVSPNHAVADTSPIPLHLDSAMDLDAPVHTAPSMSSSSITAADTHQPDFSASDSSAAGSVSPTNHYGTAITTSITSHTDPSRKRQRKDRKPQTH